MNSQQTTPLETSLEQKDSVKYCVPNTSEKDNYMSNGENKQSMFEINFKID